MRFICKKKRILSMLCIYFSNEGIQFEPHIMQQLMIERFARVSFVDSHLWTILDFRDV